MKRDLPLECHLMTLGVFSFLFYPYPFLFLSSGSCSCLERNGGMSHRRDRAGRGAPVWCRAIGKPPPTASPIAEWYITCWHPKISIVRRLEFLIPYQNFWLLHRSSGFVRKQKLLTPYQNFWWSLGDVGFARKLELLGAWQNFWFSQLNQGESKLDPNSSKLMENLKIKSWRGFLLG
jgi:hypothetical protein